MDILVCPACKADLELSVFSSDQADRIIDGYLQCTRCDKGFMIVDAIPRMLPINQYNNEHFMHKYHSRINQISRINHNIPLEIIADTRRHHKLDTIDSFGWQWKNFNQFGWQPQSKNDNWGVEKERERFFTNTLFTEDELPDRLILDGGCGNGRYTAQCIELGAEVVGIDMSPAIEAASHNLSHHPNAHFVQADIFALPFRPQTFDLVFSLGVLMHTGDTKRAFTSLASYVKKGQDISVTIYQKQNPLHEFNDKWIRAFTTRFSHNFLRDLARLLAIIAKSAWKIRCLGLINAFLRLEPIELCIFDWYNAPVATHHTYEEVRGWFHELHAVDIRDDKSSDSRDRLRKWIWPRCGFTVRGKI